MCWQQHQTEEREWIGVELVEGCNNIFENAKTVFISHRFLFYQPSAHTHTHAIHTHNHKNGERFWVSMTSFPESVFCHIPLSLSPSLSLFLSLILSFGHISPLAACVSFCVLCVWVCLEGKAQAILKNWYLIPCVKERNESSWLHTKHQHCSL